MESFFTPTSFYLINKPMCNYILQIFQGSVKLRRKIPAQNREPSHCVTTTCSFYSRSKNLWKFINLSANRLRVGPKGKRCHHPASFYEASIKWMRRSHRSSPSDCQKYEYTSYNSTMLRQTSHAKCYSRFRDRITEMRLGSEAS